LLGWLATPVDLEANQRGQFMNANGFRRMDAVVSPVFGSNVGPICWPDLLARSAGPICWPDLLAQALAKRANYLDPLSPEAPRS
jgi:hypothetical protein